MADCGHGEPTVPVEGRRLCIDCAWESTRSTTLVDWTPRGPNSRDACVEIRRQNDHAKPI